MGANTLSEADRVVQAIWVGIWFGVALLVFFYLTHRGAEGAPMRYQRLWAWVSERYLMTSAADEDAADDEGADGAAAAVLDEKRNTETGETGVATGKIAGNDPFQFPDLFTGLARLVLAEKLGETEALKLAVKATPGKGARYGEARRRLHVALAREQAGASPQFPALSEEQQAAREQLGLSQRA